MDHTDAPASHAGITLPIWGWLMAALAAVVFWTVMMEAGAGPFLHELFHDGRHLVGVPCH